MILVYLLMSAAIVGAAGVGEYTLVTSDNPIHVGIAYGLLFAIVIGIVCVCYDATGEVAD